VKGTWGRRIFGLVHKTDHYTLFRLEFTLQNGVECYQSEFVSKEELELYPELYAFVLNKLTEMLEARVAQRLA
jgi:hypothetical protein